MADYVKKSDLLDYLIYFDQKATAWNKEHFVFKQEGMSLISDTTVTAIVNHLNSVDDWDTVPGGSSEGGGSSDNTNIEAELDEYFKNKTLKLGTDAGT